MKYAEKYSNGSYPMPTQKDPDKRDKDYYKEVNEAIYALYVQNKCGIYYSAQEDFQELRDYGMGVQTNARYKNYFAGEVSGESPQAPDANLADVDAPGGWTQTPSEKRGGYMNVLWDVISPAPKIKSALLGKFQNAEYDVVASPIDAYSGEEEEKRKELLWMQAENKEFYEEYYKNAGLKMEQPEFMPGSRAELDIYQETGAFKPQYAKVMEMLSSYTFDISEWEGVKDNMMCDAIDLAVFACREYFDFHDNKFKIKYVDPAELVIQYSKYKDHRDSEFAGEFVDYTIGEIRKMLFDAGYTEEEIKSLANSYTGYLDNPVNAQWNIYDRYNNNGSCAYDFFKVSVFEAEWIETDTEQTLIHTNKQGRKKVIEQSVGTKNKDNENNETIVRDIKYKYKCSWVVGSDMVYDYGKATDIIRPNKKDISLSYHVYKLPTKSITEQLVPLYDNFAILWYKYQNAIAMATNKGYVINYDAIANLTLGGSKYDEKEILKRFLETGILIFKETNAMSQKNTAIKPLTETDGGMGTVFTELQHGFLMNINLIEHLTGLSPLTLGTVNPDAPVKTSEMAVATTNDTLRPILNGYLKIKEDVASNVVLWIQMKIKYDEDVLKGYQEVIGSDDIEVLKEAEKNNVEYGIDLIARPTDDDKRDVLEAAKISLQNGREGKPGINEADYFEIKHILTSGGSYKLAEMILSERIRRKMQEADKQAKENMILQQQSLAISEKAKLDREVAVINAKRQADIDVELAKALIQIGITNPADEKMQARLAAFTEQIRSTLQTPQPQQTAQPQQMPQPMQ